MRRTATGTGNVKTVSRSCTIVRTVWSTQGRTEGSQKGATTLGEPTTARGRPKQVSTTYNIYDSFLIISAIAYLHKFTMLHTNEKTGLGDKQMYDMQLVFYFSNYRFMTRVVGKTGR